ncbi:ABC transporter permease [Novosphingobium sp.]|uniref:ABC transporter permease n=1 Tax=Novosphingobium sp. TaxID=1874826 RepID=UPI0038B715F8
MSRTSVAFRIGAAITALFTLAGLLAQVWTPWRVAAVDIAARLQGPSGAHWLGTDQLGRDVLSLVMAGAATSLGVALLGTGAALLVGVPLGLAASAARGWLDDLLMRGADVLFAFPALLMAILLTALLGPGAINAALAIALFNVPVFARVTRGAALVVWTRAFVSAARLAGLGRVRIALVHVLPNVAPQVLVQASIQAGLALLAEAGLSYVGLGVQPPAPSWGRMLAEAQTLIGIAPRLVLVPGLAILLAVSGFLLLGDGLSRERGR